MRHTSATFLHLTAQWLEYCYYNRPAPLDLLLRVYASLPDKDRVPFSTRREHIQHTERIEHPLPVAIVEVITVISAGKLFHRFLVRLSVRTG